MVCVARKAGFYRGATSELFSSADFLESGTSGRASRADLLRPEHHQYDDVLDITRPLEQGFDFMRGGVQLHS